MTPREPALVALCLLALAACDDDNRAPALALVLDQQVVVGDTLRLVLTAEDADGDRVTFDVEGLPDAAQLAPRSKSEAVVVWSPLITDTQPGGRRYEVEVTASDGRGGVARQAIGVVVYPTFGVPAFNLPAGIVVNLASDDDLALLVEVKDDDSTDITIEMTEGPEGAKLQRAEAKSAYFYWKPDDLQRGVAVHRAIFSARDESHTPVTHVLTLVLLNAEKQSGCEGTPPNVAHGPPGDQVLDGPLVLAATATDAQSQVQSMSVHWSRDPDGNFAAASFRRDEPNGSDWTATLEVGGVPTGGALVHYYLTASDNDDPTGIACDRSGRYPKTGYYTAAVYPSGTSSATCIDDAAEPDGDASQAAALKAGTYPGRRLCKDDVDLVGIDAPPATTVVASVTWSPSHGELTARLVDQGGNTVANAIDVVEGLLTARYELPAEGSAPLWLEVTSLSIGSRISYTVDLAIEDTRCTDDAAEGDSSPTDANPIGLGQAVEQKICPGDSDFFVVPVQGGAAIDVTLTFDHRYGDLDLELRDADGVTVLATSESEVSVETITHRPQTAGDLYVRVYGFENASNAYTLAVSASQGTACTADGLGQNTTPQSAATLFQGVYEGFVACSEAPDWFTLEVNGGESVDLLLLSDGEPLRLSLFEDPAGAPVQSADTDSGGFADATWTRSGPGRLYYKVEPQPGTPAGSYSLLQEITDPGGACLPDRLEPNAEVAPAPITEGIYTWLRLCGMGDVDAFTIDLPAFAKLLVLTAHATGEQYTDVEVLGPTGQKLWESTDFGEGAYLEEVAEIAGRYTIIVRPFDVGTTLGYDLGIYVD